MASTARSRAPATYSTGSIGKSPPAAKSKLVIDVPASVRGVGRRIGPFLGYLAAFLLIYSDALIVTYGFADDYGYLASGVQGGLARNQVLIQIGWGRPTVGLLLQLAFSSMRNVSDLRYLRLVGVIGVALLAWLLYRALLAAGLARAWAFAIPLIMCAMPPFQVYVGFAETALNVLAALPAGAALLAIDRALDQWQAAERPRWRPALLGLGAFGLLTLALTIYPPTAMVFWVFAAIRLFVVDRSPAAVARRFAAYLAFTAMPFACEFLLTRLLPLVTANGSAAIVRNQLVQDKLGKINWFVQQPLVNALNLSNLAATVPVAIGVGVFTACGLLLFFTGAIWARLGKLAVALTLVPLTYLPNLLVAENSASYRTEAGLTALLALYACLAFLGYVRGWRGGWGTSQRRFATAGLVVAALTGAVLAGVTVAQEFVIPQALEYQYMVRQVRAATRTTTDSIYVIRACWCDSLAPLRRYDEFGLPSTAQPWVPVPMIRDILREIAPAKLSMRIIVADPKHPISAYRGSYVIDMHGIKSLRHQSLAVL